MDIARAPHSVHLVLFSYVSIKPACNLEERVILLPVRRGTDFIYNGIQLTEPSGTLIMKSWSLRAMASPLVRNKVGYYDCNSVVENLCNMSEALDSVPTEVGEGVLTSMHPCTFFIPGLSMVPVALCSVTVVGQHHI